ncbi:glycosyltransferase [Shewanella sp. SR44-4]|uniref:glycosyltransferase n=1 Tax=Shewanella sp. SR44-4 TaxID=2760935 RepID=UPI001600F2E2|nr:glycosyltransferase [Shewanella sp. SR44-4]MBB1363385.1 glycosyltransferase [Shewanella sp. SR44-4]
MKLLFVHDHIFCTSQNGDIYSPGGFPRELWIKYTSIFDELTVIGRHSLESAELSNKHVLSAFSSDSIRFTFVETISTPKKLIKNRKATFSIIEAAVINSDVVIARLPSENGLAALKFAEKHKKPYSVEVVGCVWDGLYNYGSMFAKLYAPIAYIRMRNTISKAKSVLYVTNSFLQQRYPNSIAPNVVNASNVNVDINIDTSHAYKFKNPVVIGMIGNYKTNYKGIDTALSAVLLLKERKVNIELRVLGNGNPKDYEKFINDNGLSNNVKFFDPLPSGAPVLEWLGNVDLYIQPSRQEGLPRSLIEALSCGKICVGSQAGGIPELLEQEFVHKTGSPKSLTEKVQYALNLSINERQTVLNNNLQRILQYDSKKLNEKRAAFYLNLRSTI